VRKDLDRRSDVVPAEMLPGANHTQMIDCPDLVVAAMMSTMA
jgi:hypothetical protein